MKVSLTFDNGPDPDVTPDVLGTLARRRIRATFFALGRNLAIADRKELAVRAVSEGHQLGNHSYHHDVPFGLLAQPQHAVAEIDATDRLIGSLAAGERLFRPFGRGEIGRHLLNHAAWEFLAANSFTCVLWNCVAREQLSPDSWMKPTLAACERLPWSVVVLHDIAGGAMRRLDEFLAMLCDRGVEFSQDFPADCTPMRHGVVTGAYEHLMPVAARQRAAR